MISTTSISISNYEDKTTNPPTTPRSLLACKRAGIFPEDIIHIPFSAFLQKHHHQKIAELYFNEYEQDRQQDLQNAKQAYSELNSNGITESEYIIMGRPKQLEKYVQEFAKPLGVDSSAVNAASERAEQEIRRANQRFAAIAEFQAQKAEERVRKNEELQLRIAEREAEEQKRIKEAMTMSIEKQKKSLEERQQRDQQFQLKLEEIRKQSQKKMLIIETRLEDFRINIQRENELKRLQREERKEKAQQHFLASVQQKEEKQKIKRQEEDQRSYEREMTITARIESFRQQQAEKQQLIQEKVIQNEQEIAKKKQDQSIALQEKMEQSSVYYAKTMEEKMIILHEKDIIRQQKIEEAAALLKQQQEAKRKNLFQKEHDAEIKYSVYHEDVLMQEKLRKTQQLIENDKRAKRAVRLAQQEQFEREQKSMAMQRRLELISDKEAQQKAQTLGLIQAKTRMEAMKLKEEYERLFKKKSPSSVNERPGTGSQQLKSSTTMRSVPSAQKSAVQRQSSGPKKSQTEILQNQNKEMQTLQQSEKIAEQGRKRQLADAQSDDERAKLMQQFAQDRKQAADQMRALNEKHKKQLDRERV
ncbi:hypothetical protein SS50377_25417 [Spironucleus salmonicida]|uniref:Trichohyalin n=1 Tax=Spironucleus salmonicida TaxID=348837 RepID=V6LK84_9EUKA|nr:hypothetical protein SS50377_25417 [Spironucleus salmonicida]|eukprot:EST44962.1 hypothetical protein SS50377_14980 [Spironucleus salmonicida]